MTYSSRLYFIKCAIYLRNNFKDVVNKKFINSDESLQSSGVAEGGD